MPNPSTIRRQAKRFKETLDEIGERLEHTPHKSLKRLSQKSGVSVSSVQRATKHTLHQPDPNKRLRFYNWLLGKVNSRELGAKEFFFSDEAWFYLHGQVVFTKLPVLQ